MTDYERMVRDAAKEIARRVRARWGAGWERISRDQQGDAIAAECFKTVLGQLEGTVEVQVTRDIFNAAIEAAGIKD